MTITDSRPRRGNGSDSDRRTEVRAGRRDRGSARLALLALGVLASAPAMTEGAVKLLECSIATVCDGQGLCSPGSGQAAFRMEPLQVEAGGIGTYTIFYGDTEAEMNAMSEVGPFVWTVEADRHALVVSSRTDWLWHQLTSGPTPAATVRFLSDCSFQR